MAALQRSLSMLVVYVLLLSVATAQEPRTVSSEEALRHLTKRVEPVYPDAALGAHIQGIVMVQTTIDESGKVIDAKALMGHPLFRDPAINAVRQWHFQPFLNSGAPTLVETQIKVDFLLGPNAELRSDYLQYEVECLKQLQNNRFKDAETACKQALEIAVKLPHSFESDKMRAYGNAGTAAYGSNNAVDALEDFRQALEFAKIALQPGSPQMIQVRSNLAHAYAATGQQAEADAEYREAEKALEAAETDLEDHRDRLKPEAYRGVKASYRHNMLVLLQEHIALLRKMAKVDDALALEQKASGLMNSQ